MFVEKRTFLCEEFDKSLGAFCGTFVMVSRALGHQIGNLEVLTAGYAHMSSTLKASDDSDRPGKKARTLEETKSLY
jgi:hypothetical protein